MDCKALRVKTQKTEVYEGQDNIKKEKYINLGYELLGDIDLKKIGFHFTPKNNFSSIQATGLRPVIGSNSSGGFGKEAIDKTFFSYGINGVMQLFNRLVNASCEVPIQTIRNAEDKKKYLLDYQKEEGVIDYKENLTIIEALEYTRRYMEDCSYFAFEANEPQYTREIDENLITNQIEEINKNLDSLNGIEVTNNLTELERMYLISKAEEKIMKFKAKKEESIDDKKIEKYDSKIQLYKEAQNFLRLGEQDISFEVKKPHTQIRCIDALLKLLDKADLGQQILAQKLSKMRSEITIGIREKSKVQLEDIRGEIIEGTEKGANFERIDYNEDMVAWIDVERYPHNAHTMIEETENGLKGVVIDGSMLQMLSLDGIKPATAVELTKHIFEQSSLEDMENFSMNMPNRIVDPLLIEDFYEYIDLYYDNKNNPIQFKEKLEKFQEKLVQKYDLNKFFNREKMSGDRLEMFVNEATREKDFETR